MSSPDSEEAEEFARFKAEYERNPDDPRFSVGRPENSLTFEPVSDLAASVKTTIKLLITVVADPKCDVGHRIAAGGLLLATATIRDLGPALLRLMNTHSGREYRQERRRAIFALERCCSDDRQQNFLSAIRRELDVNFQTEEQAADPVTAPPEKRP